MDKDSCIKKCREIVVEGHRGVKKGQRQLGKEV